MGFRQESNSSGLVEPEILSSDARRIHVRLRRGVCQQYHPEYQQQQGESYRLQHNHCLEYQIYPKKAAIFSTAASRISGS